MIRRIFRRLVRRATTPLRLWINRQLFAASEREIERLRRLRADTCTLEQIEQKQMVKLTVRLNAIQRGLL
jgi:hypothetical protein